MEELSDEPEQHITAVRKVQNGLDLHQEAAENDKRSVTGEQSDLLTDKMIDLEDRN